MPSDPDTSGDGDAGSSTVISISGVIREKFAEPPSRQRTDFFITIVFRLVWELFTLPVVATALFLDRRIDPAYGLTWQKLARLTWQMYRNSFRVYAATSYRAHLAMAAKLFEVPRSVEGVVVECGSFLGGSAMNLSLACDLVGRELVVYDSFEGMPPPVAGDIYSNDEATGGLRGTLDTVRGNIARGGVLDVCTFRQGWFEDTLPHHREPIVMCFLDVDWQASLDDCLRNLWPHLVESGLVFIDEYVLVDYCAVFFSERYWRTHFDCTPPGLLGVGTGVPLGHVFIGPFLAPAPLQWPASFAYTWKGSSGYWDYYPDS